jgi:hypothetical protein
MGTVLVGCASGPTPQNAAQYRSAVGKGGMGASLETYEVNRSYKEVAATLKAKANECLKARLVETECINRSCKDREIIYTPTVVSGPKGTELHLQWRRVPMDSYFAGGPPPPTGMYIMVADALPAGKNKTRLNVYAPSSLFRSAPDAVKHWANGTNMGCPNFAGKYK